MIDVRGQSLDALVFDVRTLVEWRDGELVSYAGVRDMLGVAARHAKLAVLADEAAEAQLEASGLGCYFEVSAGEIAASGARVGCIVASTHGLEAARAAGFVPFLACWVDGRDTAADPGAPSLARATEIVEAIDEASIVRLGSRIAYENRWMRVREDRIRRADGVEGIYGVVEKPPFSIIVAIDRGRVQLVQQHRYPVGARYWELPQGTFEEAGDSRPEDVARGELAEETGLVAGKMTRIARLYNAYGFSSQAMHVFFAEELAPGPFRREASEADMRTDAFAIDDVDRMIDDGSIVDACTIAAWHLVRRRF